MRKSSTSVSEPVMGRADVLFRFLQRIGKDRPQDIEEYLEELEPDIEDRPIADRIIDRIIAGEPELYEQYLQVRQEIGSLNPYASAENSELEISKKQAHHIFMTKFSNLDRAIKILAQLFRVKRSARSFSRLIILQQLTWIPEETQREIDYIIKLRNNVLYGLESPDRTQLLEASKSIDRVLTDIQNNIPDNLREVFQQQFA